MSNRLADLLKRFAEYFSASLLGTIVDTLVLWLCSHFLFNGNYFGRNILSPVISFECAVMVNFCTDIACAMLQSDENGTVAFYGAPDVYHVQLLKTPDGYSFDPGFEMYTGQAYSQWALRVRKD